MFALQSSFPSPFPSPTDGKSTLPAHCPLLSIIPAYIFCISPFLSFWVRSPLTSHQNCCKASNSPRPTPASPSYSQFHKFFQLKNLRGCPWLAEGNTNSLAWHQRASFGHRHSPFLPSPLPAPTNQCPAPSTFPPGAFALPFSPPLPPSPRSSNPSHFAQQSSH